MPGNTGSQAVAGKDAVRNFKDVRIGRMAGDRKTLNRKARNRKRTIASECLSLVMYQRLIGCIDARIIDFQQGFKPIAVMVKMVVRNAYAGEPIPVFFNMRNDLTGNFSRIDDQRFFTRFISDPRKSIFV